MSREALETAKARYLTTLRAVPEQVGQSDCYPWSLPFVADLDLEITGAVTFLVGENGSGKSTLLEALVKLSGLPVGGGGKNELGAQHAPDEDAPLAVALLHGFAKKPRDSFFFRAEFAAHFASLLEEREKDPLFEAPAYGRYGGRSLHTRSHGEAFLELAEGAIHDGLYFLDEPESALSPQRQLHLLALLAKRVLDGAQFFIATHSPILLTFPGATILRLDEHGIAPVELEDTDSYQVTRGMLDYPASYWRHLVPPVEGV